MHRIIGFITNGALKQRDIECAILIILLFSFLDHVLGDTEALTNVPNKMKTSYPPKKMKTSCLGSKTDQVTQAYIYVPLVKHLFKIEI